MQSGGWLLDAEAQRFYLMVGDWTIEDCHCRLLLLINFPVFSVSP